MLYISFICLSKMLPRNDAHFATCNSIPKKQQASNLIPRALKTIIGNYSSSIKSAAHSHSKLSSGFWAWFDYDCCLLSFFSKKFYATVWHYKCISFFHVELLPKAQKQNLLKTQTCFQPVVANKSSIYHKCCKLKQQEV